MADREITFGNSVGNPYVVFDWFQHGNWDLFVHTPATKTWEFYCPLTGETETFVWGEGTDDIPFFGRFYDDRVAAAIQSNSGGGRSYIRNHDSNPSTNQAGPIYYGSAQTYNDMYQSNVDITGNGSDTITIFRGNSGVWYSQGVGSANYGDASDIPFPGKWLEGSGASTDIGLFRPSTGQWFRRSWDAVYASNNIFGNSDDIPIPGDWNGDGLLKPGMYRPSNDSWYMQVDGSAEIVSFGDSSATHRMAADVDGDGVYELITWEAGEWNIHDFIPRIGYLDGRVVHAAFKGTERLLALRGNNAN